MVQSRFSWQPAWFLAALVVLIVAVVFLVQRRPVTTPATSQQTIQAGDVQVVASFYPVYYFASQIGMPHLSLTNVTPYGSEPHDYEPTAQQVAQIQDSQLLLLNGSGFEPWAERLVPQLPTNQPLVVETSNDQADPHVWLSPVLAQAQVAAISQGLIQVDPEHQADYTHNQAALIAELQTLDQEFKTGLANCQQRSFVTSHDAFGHLAETYNLEQRSIAGLSPDEEPPTRQLAQITQYIKANNIRYIFFETLASPKLSETLAQETGAQTLVLDPLEGLSQNQIAEGANYFTVMRQNLANLRVALACQ